MPESAANPNGTTGTTDPGRTPGQRDNDVVAEMRQFLRDLDKQTNQAGKEREILDKNFRIRRKLAEANDRIATLEAQGPKDGGRVLTKDEAAEYDAFKALNVKAADLKTLVTEHGELKTKLADREAEELYVDVADTMGFANLEAFGRWLEREKLHIEMKDVQVRDEETGKMVTERVPMVRPKADEKAQLEPLADFMEREVPDFVAVFETAPDEAESDEETPSASTRGESLDRQFQRFGEGDREARRAAGLPATGAAGVRMPATRNARPSTGASRTDKKQREALEEKRQNPAYALL